MAESRRAAAASLYDNISLLNLATPHAFDVYNDEKIRNMAKFIYRAQISEKYFLNFADADPQPKMASNMIYRFGKDIRDEDMMKFGAFYREPSNVEISRSHYFRNFFALFIQDEFKNAAQAALFSAGTSKTCSGCNSFIALIKLSFSALVASFILSTTFLSAPKTSAICATLSNCSISNSKLLVLII